MMAYSISDWDICLAMKTIRLYLTLAVQAYFLQKAMPDLIMYMAVHLHRKC